MSLLLRCYECGHKCERQEAIRGESKEPCCPLCWGTMIQTAASIEHLRRTVTEEASNG